MDMFALCFSSDFDLQTAWIRYDLKVNCQLLDVQVSMKAPLSKLVFHSSPWLADSRGKPSSTWAEV